MNFTYIRFFADFDIPLQLVGGKGKNLALLYQNNFSVPPGFIITTDFYRNVVKLLHIEDFILQQLPKQAVNYTDLENIALNIRKKFHETPIADEYFNEIFTAYNKLKNNAVAVRSSATTEDSEEHSFAGQHDTVLNVIDQVSLKRAILDCLSSLWTARAIAYRFQNKISHAGLAIAIVVQTMVQSKASGVLFTVNPLTGHRSEYVIDAILGLGEALVSGKVEPDQYCINLKGTILSKKIGEKKLSLHSQESGGTKIIDEKASKMQAIPDSTIRDLLNVGTQIKTLFGSPQDIEWAIDAHNRLFILQSRPITTLFPLSEKFLAEKERICFSLNAVQGLMDPFTPLGQDVIMRFILSIPTALGYHPSITKQQLFWIETERIWLSLKYPLSYKAFQKITFAVLPFIDPRASDILRAISNEEIMRAHRPIHAKALRRIMRGLASKRKIMKEIFSTPREAVKAHRETVETILDSVRSAAQNCKTSEDHLAFITAIYAIMPNVLLNHAIPFIPVGLGPFIRLPDIFPKDMIHQDLILKLTRGLPNNPTTIMNLELWNVAKIIKGDKEAVKCFQEHSIEEITQLYLSHTLPSLASYQAISAFLEKYGARGFGEIDIARPRWVMNPTPVINNLKMMLNLPNDQTPDIQFKNSYEEAKIAYKTLYNELVNQKKIFKLRIFNIIVKRVRLVTGLREYPKFTIVRFLLILRKKFEVLGEDLTSQGVIGDPQDIFFLHFSEIEQLFKNRKKQNTLQPNSSDWKAKIVQRKTYYHKEQQRKQVPRVIISDGRTYYESPLAKKQKNTLNGSPVSPGTVEGIARIVFDPFKSELKKGEILVCPATDPSWTPLFLIASGLIMEIGGLMVHGAVVAREQNIPAVVGVHQATTRIREGQKIRINGTTGEITLLD